MSTKPPSDRNVLGLILQLLQTLVIIALTILLGLIYKQLLHVSNNQFHWRVITTGQVSVDVPGRLMVDNYGQYFNMRVVD